jgi:nucleoside-diphosphate kinase
MKFKEEKTLVLIKPDGVKRGLIGEIIGRIEQRGLKFIALRLFPDRHVVPSQDTTHIFWMNIPMRS